MSEPDVVAELAWWMRLMAEDPDDRTSPITAHDMLKRGHDEIVALREMVERQRLVLSKGHAEVRSEALEEAARLCEGGYTTGSTASTLKAIAAAIRALKEQGDRR